MEFTFERLLDENLGEKSSELSKRSKFKLIQPIDDNVKKVNWIKNLIGASGIFFQEQKCKLQSPLLAVV